jgi:hypothetical protein
MPLARLQRADTPAVFGDVISEEVKFALNHGGEFAMAHAAFIGPASLPVTMA